MDKLDEIVQEELRMKMKDSSARSRRKSLSVSYTTLVKCHGVAWIFSTNKKVAIYHVPSAVQSVVLRNRLEVDLYFAKHSVRKDFKGFMQHDLKLPKAVVLVNNGSRKKGQSRRSSSTSNNCGGSSASKSTDDGNKKSSVEKNAIRLLVHLVRARPRTSCTGSATFPALPMSRRPACAPSSPERRMTARATSADYRRRK